MYAGAAKAITGSVLYKSQARNEELSFVEEFRYLAPIYGCALRRRSYQNSIRKLTISYSNDLLMSHDTPPCVWQLQ